MAAKKSGKATAGRGTKVTRGSSATKSQGGKGQTGARDANDDTITETFTGEDGEETVVVRRARKKATRVGAGRTKGTTAGATSKTNAPTAPTAVGEGTGGRKPDAHKTDADKPPVGATTAKGKKRGRKGTGISLENLGERFLRHLEQAGKSRTTVFSYSIDVGLMCRELSAETDVGTITEDQIAEYFASPAITKTRTNKPKSPLTIAKSRRVARQVFEFAAAQDFIQKSPIPEPSTPTRKHKAAAAKNDSDSRKSQGEATTGTDK